MGKIRRKSMNKSADKGANKNVRQSAKNAKESAEKTVKKAEETVKESKIKPVEPLEPLEPLEPIGGRTLKGEAEEAASETEKVSIVADVQGSAAVGKEKVKEKKKRISIYDTTMENDIRYKGVLSYRHFRIAAWVCMAFTVANVFLGAGMKLSESVMDKYSGLHTAFSFFSEFAIFLFLFANFAVIIDKKSPYKNLFILYGTLTVGFVILFAIVYYRYLGGLVGSIANSAGQTINKKDLLGGGFMAINIFLDMLLCTAIIFFIDYRPKKFFVGKKLYIFRLLLL